MRRIAPLAAAVLGAVALVAAPVQAAPAKLMATMTGEEEVPGPGGPGAKGMIHFDADPDAGKICYEMTTENSDKPSMGHIHEGGKGTAGPIKVDLMVDKNGPKGCVPADGKLLSAIIANPDGFYANMHTTTYPAGVMRGQLTAG